MNATIAEFDVSSEYVCAEGYHRNSEGGCSENARSESSSKLLVTVVTVVTVVSMVSMVTVSVVTMVIGYCSYHGYWLL